LHEEAHGRAAEALRQFEAFYARGAIRSPADGVVGARVPVPGQVVKFGDELLQINGRRMYVLAYLPDIYLFSVNVGESVRLDGGATTARGRIEAILSVADALPPEFQNMFRPRDRSRLIRVSLPPEQGFAVSQKVRVGGCALGWCWSL
jgi:multidrug resistance efflux pump